MMMLAASVARAAPRAGDPVRKLTSARGSAGALRCRCGRSAHEHLVEPDQAAGGLIKWARRVVEGWFRVWDLAKPVIAQVHGYCLAGGTELATACDLVYVADDAQIGYPPVRLMSPPDMQFHPWLMGMRQAMESMLTGDALSGREAAEKGWATRAFPVARLEAEVLAVAERVAKLPTELAAINKRSVHRAMEAMGMRAATRAGSELQALAFQTEPSKAYITRFRLDCARVSSPARARDAPLPGSTARGDEKEVRAVGGGYWFLVGVVGGGGQGGATWVVAGTGGRKVGACAIEGGTGSANALPPEDLSGLYRGPNGFVLLPNLETIFANLASRSLAVQP